MEIFLKKNEIENNECKILLKYLNKDFKNSINKNKEIHFSFYLTKNDKFKIKNTLKKLEYLLKSFIKNKEEILSNLNILDSNYSLIKQKSEEYQKRNSFFIQVLHYYYDNYKLNEKNKTLSDEIILNIKNAFSLIHFAEFIPQNIDRNKVNRNPINFLHFISSEQTNFFQETNLLNYNFSTLKKKKEEKIENIKQMLILKDEEICIITHKTIYFYDPYSLQLDRKFDNISLNTLNYIIQINDGRLFIGTDNCEITIWEIIQDNGRFIKKINKFNIIGTVFKIIQLDNNYFAVSSSKKSIFIIEEKTFNFFEINYVILNDDYYDFDNEKFSILNFENKIISYSQEGIISVWNFQSLKKIGRIIIELNDNDNYNFYSENLINISEDLIGVISYKKIYIINIQKLEINSIIYSNNKIHNFYKFQNEIFLIDNVKGIQKLLPQESRLETSFNSLSTINQFVILKNTKLILYTNYNLILYDK